MNIINIALTSRAFLFFAYPKQMSGEFGFTTQRMLNLVDGYTGATALGHLAETVGKAIDSAEVIGIMSIIW